MKNILGARARRPQFTLFLFLALALLLVAAFLALQGTPVFPVDDAYITLNSAQGLLAGGDRNFAGTPALTGATSVIHVVLVALLLPLFEPLWALQWAVWLAICLYVFGLARLASQHGLPAPLAALVTIVGCTIALVPHQLTNGLETGLAMAALVWTLVAYHGKSPRSHWTFLVLCGQLPFLRPELAALSLLLLLAKAWDRRAAGSIVQRLVIDAAVVLLAALPWLLLYYRDTGLPYPSTIMAKKFYFAEGCLPLPLKTEWVEDRLMEFARTVGFLCLAGVLLIRTNAGRAGLLFFGIFVAAYFISFPGALRHYEQRYLYVFIPFLVYGVVTGLSAGMKFARGCAAVILALATVQSLIYIPRYVEAYRYGRGITANELDGVAAWAQANLPAGARLLVHDAGYIAFASQFKLVDLVGLKSPQNVRFHAQQTWPSCGKARGDAIGAIARAGAVDHLVVLRGWDEIFKISESLGEHGWTLKLLRDSAHYQVYEMRQRL